MSRADLAQEPAAANTLESARELSWSLEVTRSADPGIPVGSKLSIVVLANKDRLLEIERPGLPTWGPYPLQKERSRFWSQNDGTDRLEYISFDTQKLPRSVRDKDYYVFGVFASYPKAVMPGGGSGADPEDVGVWGAETKTPPPTQDGEPE